MLRSREYIHLERNNYVFISEKNTPMSNYVCITEELWQKLLENKSNQELINSLKIK